MAQRTYWNIMKMKRIFGIAHYVTVILFTFTRTVLDVKALRNFHLITHI